MEWSKSDNRIIKVRNLGLIDYKSALEIQESYFEKSIHIKLENKGDSSSIIPENYLFLCEHFPVYTLGKSGSKDHLLLNANELLEKSIELYSNNRGGDITYHGPSQIVGYPIIDLEQFAPDIKNYMYSLEEVIILTLGEFGLKGERITGEIGVWLESNTPFARKISAFGVKTSRWITMHGWALNVNTDLSYFDFIIPCGIKDKGVTSMQKELGKFIDIDVVKERLLFYFGSVFDAETQFF